MDIQTLKRNLANAMPILDANLAAAHREYMAGDIPAGAYHHVLSRHGTACEVLSRDDIAAEEAFKACALISIDLRRGTKDFAGGDTSVVDAWWQCYRDAGFTADNPLYNTPMLPSGPRC
ncbi:hypothetical protein EFK68_03805 [Pseudomonas aeruginosa]|uniref:hypothetical protein n=1 Tax=Pseudomonas aeruginosa TaxID=287 RepID=UPI00093FF1DA|nr:hypothetical protein [Pseudomonas aeruginosa]EKF7416906.1 hypothetical protein [Pseudomonas aeruginosa]MDS9918391.1 hypothetical protein [Pseudomonas aeruginosa]RNF58510.1 hypothetical protein EFK68_03805 [Pseudomonas aeruginosa]CAI9794762.1 L-rhamnose mutarotase [Pseudomonas aeruginosa]CAI9912151.1 L-rhamnose mutarotase [Pseudomonas aeruginosa]